MSDETCKTCKWWSEGEEQCNHKLSGETTEPAMWGYEEVVYGEWTTCTESVRIHCGPDFGCIHHERKAHPQANPVACLNRGGGSG